MSAQANEQGRLVALEAREVDGYVALGREGKHAMVEDAAAHSAAASGRARYAERKWLSEAPNR